MNHKCSKGYRHPTPVFILVCPPSQWIVTVIRMEANKCCTLYAVDPFYEITLEEHDLISLYNSWYTEYTVVVYLITMDLCSIATFSDERSLRALEALEQGEEDHSFSYPVTRNQTAGKSIIKPWNPTNISIDGGCSHVFPMLFPMFCPPEKFCGFPSALVPQNLGQAPHDLKLRYLVEFQSVVRCFPAWNEDVSYM